MAQPSPSLASSFTVVERVGPAHVLAGPTPWPDATVAAVELDDGSRCAAEVQRGGIRAFYDQARLDAAVAGPRAARVFHVANDALVREIVPGIPLAALAGALPDGSLPVVACVFAAREIARAIAPGVKVPDGDEELLLYATGDQFVVSWAGDVRLQVSGREQEDNKERFAWLTPEQARGMRPRPATGAHAVAHALYTLLEQRHPWKDTSSAFTTLDSIVRHEREPLRRADVPDAVRDVVERGLLISPDQRLPTIQIAQRLDEAVDAIGGDPRSFLAGFVAEAFPREREEQLSFLEQLQLAEL